jgi:single-stranded-DNA-specific exonuclease
MLNTERKTLEALTLEDAIHSVKNSNKSTDTVVIAVGSEWHVGVLGIIASRLKGEYHKPTFIMTLDEKKGIAKGSVRSIYGVDAAMLIQEAKDLSLILEGGGHAMAGGFSIAKDKIDEFSQYLQKRTAEIIKGGTDILSEARKVMVDAAISIQGVRPELFNEISKLEPFGLGNPKPYFMIDNVIIKNISYSKGICFITICDVFDQTQVLKCLCFITSSNNIADFLTQYCHNVIRVLGTLQANNMYAGYVNFVIDDICVYE